MCIFDEKNAHWPKTLWKNFKVNTVQKLKIAELIVVYAKLITKKQNQRVDCCLRRVDHEQAESKIWLLSTQSWSRRSKIKVDH